MRNSLATSMKRTDALAQWDGSSQRVEMLGQYVKAIDETILSFQQACQQHPQDERLADAFARFRRKIESQMGRLEAMRHRFTGEVEIRALDQVIQSLKQVA